MPDTLTKPCACAPSAGQLAEPFSIALSTTDRNVFIDAEQKGLIAGRSVPATETLGKILTPLALPSDAKARIKIMHIGSGTGYITAVLAHAVRQVVAVEQSAALVKAAQQHMQELHINNVHLCHGEGRQGAPQQAPYDIIVITTPKVSDKSQLHAQLRPGGQMLCLESTDTPMLLLVKYTKSDSGKMHRSEHGLIDFVQDRDSLLIDLGVTNKTLLLEAHRRAKANQTLIIDEVRRLKNLDEGELYRALSGKYGVELGNVEALLEKVDVSLFDQFSRTFLDHQKIIPLFIENYTLKVATRDPDVSLAELHNVFPGHKAEKVLVTPTDYQRLWSAIALSLKRKENHQTFASENAAATPPDKIYSKEKLEFEAYLISVFDALLLDAVAHRASDIHIEQYGDNVRIRLRIDGSLVDTWHYDITPQKLRGLINVIKLRADLNIAERRLPQGGRTGLRVGDDAYDLRIQVQPSLHGEHVVIRLLPQNTELIAIENLGLPFGVASSYKRLLRSPAGLVLVVGPTGSGKSTTLYAGLQLLASDSSRKVITVEDPIEYSINNIQQTRVRPEIGFHFSDAMRSFVRQDPDVILVGEIRDHETALEAIRASQTGHVVLSTLHCNDSVDAMQRLFDLNIHPNSLASELLAVMAQRLAKRICPHCRVADNPATDLLHEVFPDGTPKSFRSFIGRGCNHCNGSGTHGRVAVVEYLQLNADIRNAISRQLPVDELRRLALDCGLVAMRDSALDHVIQGTIPLSELPRILPAERMAPEPRCGWEKVS